MTAFNFRFLFLVFLGVLVATVSAGTNQEGLAFLAKKATEDGVVKLDSGLMYKGKEIVEWNLIDVFDFRS